MGKEKILMNISGPDRPGVTSSLTAILGQYNATILDIGQAVIHNGLGLGILFEVPEKESASPILKDLLFKAYEMGMSAKFTPTLDNEYKNWVKQQVKQRYILTVLGKKLTAKQISAITKVISSENLNIDTISRLTGRVIDPDGKNDNVNTVVEMALSGNSENVYSLRCEILNLSRTQAIDIALQTDNIFRRNRRLVCFDMDSTLIQTEVIDEIAEIAGKGGQVKAITESAMKGEIDFKESFTQRMSLLKGVEEKQLLEIAKNLPLTNGAGRLFRILKKYGYKTAILSGGFTYFGKYLQNLLGIDYVYANQLDIIDGKLTGNYLGEIIDGAQKASLLKKLAEKENIHLEQVIAVGDGSNDLPMLNVAGLGIAFHAKPIVKQNAKTAISSIGLDAILYLMGFRDREIESN